MQALQSFVRKLLTCFSKLAESVAKLIVLNTPLGLKTPLRPELAACELEC